MPDTPPGAGTAADGSDASHLSNGDGSGGPVDGRESLDVPEWVSELRRLYVEPKTRAKLRQEGAITPQKRRRGLTGGRGSRREATPATPASDAGAAVGAAAAAGTPFAPEALRPAPLEPADNMPTAAAVAAAATPPEPLVDESGAPYTPPDSRVEEEVATWLTSYLVATGHASGDEVPGPEPTEPAAVPSASMSTESSDGIPTEATAGIRTEATAGIRTEATAGVSTEVGSGVRAEEAAPNAVDTAHQLSEHESADDEHPESHPRSLAELAGLAAPEGAPTASRPAFAATRVESEGVLELIEPGSPAEPAEPASPAEPGPEPASPAEPGPDPAVTTSEHQGSASPDVLGPDVLDPAASGVGGTEEVGTQAPDPEEPVEGSLEEPPVEQAPVPGRPSTVPAVTLSWREAESFEIGVPDVEDSEGAIVVEPPSQLVAARRGRRRELDADADDVEESVVADRVPAPAPPEEAPATRASTRAASGYPLGKRRRALIVGLVLLMLAIVAWYFLIRGHGDQDSGASAAPIGQSRSVVALSPLGSS